ncbi:iron chelate uptake ABC transporter family permease subunit [Streptomyces sp. NPDC007164]|uniref:iron chelate uptake ABC transporter family permease subunit n=1 Tax=Streptomyces sp. NPDC007164 TaxID=3156918 RepID=UPI003401C2E0
MSQDMIAPERKERREERREERRGERRGERRRERQEERRATRAGRGGRAWRVAPSALVAALLLLLAGSAVLSVSISQVDVPVRESARVLLDGLTGIGGPGDPMFVDVIWNIRLPRVLLAAVVGGGLALCGTVMQATLQNPLADPFVLGISSGASLGAAFAILTGFGAAGAVGPSPDSACRSGRSSGHWPPPPWYWVWAAEAPVRHRSS